MPSHIKFFFLFLNLVKQTHSCTTQFLKSTRRHCPTRTLITQRPSSRLLSLDERHDLHLNVIRPWQWMSCSWVICSLVQKSPTLASLMFYQNSCSRLNDRINSEKYKTPHANISYANPLLLLFRVLTLTREKALSYRLRNVVEHSELGSCRRNVIKNVFQ